MVSYRDFVSFIWQFISRQKGIFCVMFFLAILAWPLESLGWPYILHWVIDIFSRFEGNRDTAWQALQSPIIAGICLVIFVETASRATILLLGKAIPKLQADIRMKMFDHIQHHSPHYFNERFSGNLANKMTDMTTQVELIIQQLFWPIIPAIVMCIAGTTVLFLLHPVFAGIMFTWIVIHLGITYTFIRSIDIYEHQHGEARSTLLGKIVDSFTNNFAVNLFYRFKYENDSLTPFQAIEEKTNVQAKQYVEKMCCFTSFLYIIGPFLWTNGYLLYLWIHHQLDTGQVIQVFNTIWNLTSIIWMVGRSLPVLFQSCGIAKQAYTVMCDSQDLGDKPAAQALQISSGEIVFDNVSFHYGEKQLFSNKQAHIRGGERVGLVGFTGGGKSTFINLILRFFPLHKGHILIDGQDVANVTLKSLRRQIALIPQDPMLFHRTLWENICYGKPSATKEEVINAAKMAHCDEFIRNLPNGYETKVGERGTKLSGGERQRIAIARAILANAPILILDEATSALDSVTEKYIQDSLDQLMDNRTTIVIAHRLSTLSRMDRILVFDQGKIVEDGTHAVLLNKMGLYAKMWKMQVGGFLPKRPS